MINTQGRTFPKLQKFFAKTEAATREARGIKLRAKFKGGASRSAGGEEREPHRARLAASVVLPVGAESAAAALCDGFRNRGGTGRVGSSTGRVGCGP